jgi:RHS repeat-associated protein
VHRLIVVGMVAALIAAAGIIAGSTPVLGAKTSQAQRRAAAPGRFDLRVAHDAADRKRKARSRRLTAKARAARIASRTAYSGLNGAKPLATLAKAFPSVIEAKPSSPIRGDVHALKYLDNQHTAIVVSGKSDGKRGAKRRRRILASALPLRARNRDGKLALLDNSIEAHGPDGKTLQPGNALTAIAVDRDLSHGITFADAGVSIRPSGVAADRVGDVQGDHVFWGNVQTDTDFLVTMLPAGVETYNILRSRSSPERLGFEVGVPDGGSLAVDDEIKGINVLDGDGKIVARIAPPMAGDADGRRVQARWVVNGTTLELQVDHRSGDFRYPILVDPFVTIDQRDWSTNSTIDFSGWTWHESWAGLSWLAGTGSFGRGLNIWLGANITPPAGLWGAWEFRAPGDTYVSRFEASHLTWFPGADRSCITNGILGGELPVRWDPAQVVVLAPGGGSWTDSSPWARCAATNPTGFADNYDTHTLQGTNWDTVTRGNAAAVQWWTPGGVAPNSSNVDLIFLGGAAVQITDDRLPTNVTQSGIPNGWTNNPNISFTASARDNGFGMQFLGAMIDDPNDTLVDPSPNYVGGTDTNCNLDPQHGSYCPPTASVALNRSVLDGVHVIDLYAVDAVDNVAGDTYWVGLDRTKPKVAVAGPAFDMRGRDVGESAYDVDVTATEPGKPGGNSGIASVELLVDGNPSKSATWGCDRDCENGVGAGLNATLSFDTDSFADGPHTVQVRAKDHAGNATTSDPWTLTVVSGSVSQPLAGAHSSRRVTLQAHARRSGMTGVTWQWRPVTSGAPGDWTTIPAAALRDAAGNQPGSTTLGMSGSDSTPVSWDIKATPNLANVYQQIEVRGVFAGGAGGATSATPITYDTKGLDSRASTADVGVGAVNLLTGNLAVDVDDIDIDAGLTDLRVHRTYNSRNGDVSGPLGPGWTLTTPFDDQGVGVVRLVIPPSAGYAEAQLGDGTKVPFAVTAKGFTAVEGFERWSLKSSPPNGGSVAYTMEDTSTGKQILLSNLPGGDDRIFYPYAYKIPLAVVNGAAATDQASIAAYDASTGTPRLATLYASAPSGVDCQANFVRGCRALEFHYAATTTATGMTSSEWGDFDGRLSHIDFKAYDPSTQTIAVESVKSYTYDGSGRLRAAWDPRIDPLKTTYDYDANGLMTSLTPPGDEPWAMSYATAAGETELGRLYSVTRSGAAGPATSVVAYDVPVTGTGAPKNLTPATVGQWGQTDLPTDAAAVFPPDQVPTFPIADYSHATLHYLDANAYEVDTALPGMVSGYSRLATTERDRYGNVVRELTAANRVTALLSSNPAATSHQLDTQRTYVSNGLEMTDELGPLHRVELNSGEVVDARRHVTVAYDQTKPSGDDRIYHLPTTQVVAAQVAGRPDADAHKTTLDYDWVVRKPKRQVDDAGAGGLALVHAMTYDDATGMTLTRTQPRAPDYSAAANTRYIPYTAGSNADLAACGNHPEWVGMMCAKRPQSLLLGSARPTLTTKTYTYDKYGKGLTETVTGDASRTTTNTYDRAERLTSKSVTSTGAAGATVPNTTTTYDGASGRIAEQSAVVDGITRTTEFHYDALGRLQRYVDATDKATTTTYDIDGRIATVDDGKGTQTLSYDALTGQLTSVVDSQAGTFRATYDADGKLLTKTLPGGLKAIYMTDAEGTPYDLSWTKSTGCTSDCNWMHFNITRSIEGKERALDSTQAQQAMTYDGVGRLTEVRDTPANGGCTVRQYGYDPDSNRVTQDTHRPGAQGACDTSASTLDHVTHSYDAADRLTDSGVTYDAFNRTTVLPGADAGGHKLTTSYFVDDRMRSQSQGGRTTTYDLDPQRRIMKRTVNGTGTETTHYSGNSDSASWSETSDGHWSRAVSGLDGGLLATVADTTGPVLQMTDLHGDVVATAATSTTKIADARVLSAKRTGSTWTATSARSLPAGSYVATVRQNDASGNAGSATSHFKVTGAGASDREYRDTVAGDDPESYWRLGEASGTTGADQQPAGRTLTYAGNPALGQTGALASDSDTAIGFDGGDDYATAQTQPWRAGSGEFSVETWIKTTQRGGTVMAQGSANDPVSWSLRVDDAADKLGTLRADANEGGTILRANSVARVDDGRWHHVVVSFSGLTTKVTVDDVTSTTTAADQGAPAYVWNFDEGSGGVLHNSGTAGSAGDGTIAGATWTTGHTGGGLSFTGTQSVHVPDGPAMRATRALTLEAWIKPTTWPSIGSVLAKTPSGGNSTSVWGLMSVLGSPRANVGTSYGNIRAQPANQWMHFALTWSATTGIAYAYINGLRAAVFNVPTIPVDNGGDFVMGTVSLPFQGVLDDVKIYQRELSDSEVASDVNAPAAWYDRNAPVAAYDMESSGSTSVLTDRTGRGHNVTLTAPASGLTPGHSGFGLALDGTDNGSFSDIALSAPTPGLTLSAWVKSTGYTSTPLVGQSTFGLYGAASTTSGPGVCTGTTCLRAPAQPLGTWTHLTATWDSTNMRLYANGALVGSVATTAPSLANGTVYIGQDTLHGQAAFNGGVIDDVRAYPRALPAAEVARDEGVSVTQSVGGNDPTLTVGRDPSGGTAFQGQLDETAVYPRVLSSTEIDDHYRARSQSTTVAAPTISLPAAGATLADATPQIVGTGSDKEASADDLRVDLFSGTDTTQPAVQSLTAARGGTSWNTESAKGLPAGTYTAKVTQSDASGSFASAQRTFRIAGATDPETGYATSVRADDPAAYWRLGEASGTTAGDDRTSHPGTYAGSPALGGGGALSTDDDRAPSFDGADDRVDVPASSGFWDPGTADFSIEAWVKTTANGGEVVASKGSSWSMAVSGTAGHVGQAMLSYANGAVVAYSTGRVDDGAWHHVVAVADRDTSATVFVDGSAGPVTASPNTTALTSADGVSIGAGPAAGWFNGQIDEVAVYRKALAASRILAHYRLGAQLDGAAPSPTVGSPATGSSVSASGLAFSGTAGAGPSDARSVTVTVAPDASAGPLQTYSYDEFGVPADTSAVNRYGYLGGKERATETATGAIAMGARSYVPTIGRFLQPDPVDGGSANPYDYAYQDPFNQFDLNGEWSVDIAAHATYASVYFSRDIGKWIDDNTEYFSTAASGVPIVCAMIPEVPKKICVLYLTGLLVNMLHEAKMAVRTNKCLVLHVPYNKLSLFDPTSLPVIKHVFRKLWDTQLHFGHGDKGGNCDDT